MAGVRECTRASALPPPLRKAMLPGQSSHSKGDTLLPKWETGSWSSQSHLSTGGTSQVRSHAGTFTLHDLPLSVPMGTPVSPRRMLKMGVDGSFVPPGGQRELLWVSGVSKQCCRDNWRSSPTRRLHPLGLLWFLHLLFTPMGLTSSLLGGSCDFPRCSLGPFARGGHFPLFLYLLVRLQVLFYGT